MSLTIFDQTFGKARVKRGQVARLMKDDSMREHLVEVLDAVQSVVDVMRDPNTGDRYVVSLDPNVGASTTPGTKHINITWKPVFDKSIRISTACTVMTGLVFHEVGHTLDTFPNLPAFEAVYGKPGDIERGTAANGWKQRKRYDALAYSLLNIADDVRLERRQAQRFPIARDVFPTMLHWVALNTGMVGKHVRWDAEQTMQGLTNRMNFVSFATRYPWCAVWAKDAVTRTERAWWQSWATAYGDIAEGDTDAMLASIAEGLDRLRSPEREDIDEDEVDDEPEPEAPVNPGTDFDEDDEDEDADDDETDDEPGDDTDGGDDDTDEPGDDDGPDWDDFDDDDSDEDGETNPGGDDGEDADDDETDPEGGKGEPDEDADEDETEPGGGNDDTEDGDEPGTETKPGTETEGGDEPTDDGEGKDGTSSDTPPEGWDEDDEADGDDGKPKQDVPPTMDPDDPDRFDKLLDFDSRNIEKGVDGLNHSKDYYDRNVGHMMAQVIYKERSIDRVKTGLWGTAKVKAVSAADWRKD